MPVTITCDFAPVFPARIVLDQAINRDPPSRVSQYVWESPEDCAEFDCAKIALNVSISSVIKNKSQTNFPRTSSNEYPVVCSQVRLKRTMRPLRSRTTTRA